MTTSKLTLNAAVAACPDSLFGDVDKGIPPKFSKIFARVATALLKDKGEKFDEATVQLVADTINPSSMQRVVAKHRETLTGRYDKATGKYKPLPEKPPKKERGKPRPSKDDDDLGLGSSKKVKANKKAKGLKAGTVAKINAAAQKAVAASKNPELAKAKAKAGKKKFRPSLTAAEEAIREENAKRGGQKINNSSKNPELAKAKAKAAAEKAQKTPAKAEKKAATTPKSEKAAKTGLDAIAAARAALAAKKAAKAPAKDAEVEI